MASALTWCRIADRSCPSHRTRSSRLAWRAPSGAYSQHRAGCSAIHDRAVCPLALARCIELTPPGLEQLPASRVSDHLRRPNSGERRSQSRPTFSIRRLPDTFRRAVSKGCGHRQRICSSGIDRALVPCRRCRDRRRVISSLDRSRRSDNPYLMSIFLGEASFFFGIRMSRTPFLNSAWILSRSPSAGREIVRMKAPSQRSHQR